MEEIPGHPLQMRDAKGAGRADSLDSGTALSALQTAFAQAVNAYPDRLRESYYTFAGHSVRIRIVGRKLAEHLARPLTHLETDRLNSTAAHLTIDLWDEEETGIPCPVPSTYNDLSSRWTVGDGFLTGSPDGRFVVYQLQQAMTWLDRKNQHVIGWTASGRQLSLYERGKPLHKLLSVWYDDRDVRVIHAGLVSRNGQGVLFAGMGGSGKSTSALACLHAGFDYLGDDYIGLQALAEGSFVGHSLYNSTWFEPDHMKCFPLLPPHAIRGNHPWEDKFLILLSDVFPDRLARTASIRVLALPRIINASRSLTRPASKGEALLRLAPSSLLALAPRPGARALERLAKLVEHVPSYWLELGRDLSEIPERVQELLAGATRS